MKEGFNRRYLRLVTGVVSLLFAGIIYAWSILKVPLASEFGWNASQLALNFTLTMCFFAIGGMVSGVIVKRTGPKAVIIAGGILSAAGFFISSRNTGSISMLYLSYGVMSGLGIGFAYNAIVSSTNSWFPDKRGLSSGILMIGFGMSSLVIGNLSNTLINSPGTGWRKTYVILAVCLGAVLTGEGFFAAFPKYTEQGSNDKAQVSQSDDTDTRTMLRESTFWKFYLYLVTLTAVGNVVISAARDMAISTGASAALATSLVGVLAVCNGLGRLLSGSIYDKFGRRTAMTAGCIVSVLAPAFILAGIMTKSVISGVTGICLSGLSYGFSPTVSAAVTGEFYGQKYFPLNFAIASTILIPTSFVATLVGSVVTSTGSYVIPCIILIILAAISMVLSVIIKRPAK